MGEKKAGKIRSSESTSGKDRKEKAAKNNSGLVFKADNKTYVDRL